MNKYLKKLPRKLKNVIRQATEVSVLMDLPAYLVGGCLRDLILGTKNLDLDITVEGDGILFAGQLAKRLKSELIVHERFRTATLILSPDLKVDIATTRQEKYPANGALPVVSPGSLKDDLRRRDFTINALALSLLSGQDQEIIDPFGGQIDLALRRIRILHDLSFQDDPTRIFRAVRFSQRFDFKIETKTLVLLKQAINAGLLDRVSLHRMRDELIILLKEQDPFKPLKALSDLGGLSFISTKLKIGKSTFSLFQSIAKQIAWFVKNFPSRRPLDAWLVYFAALLAPLPLAQVKMIMAKLGLPKGDQKRLVSYGQKSDKLISALSKKNLLPDEVFALLEPLSYETIILLSATATNKNFKKYLADFLGIYKGMRLCVCGSDLGSLGLLPGPAYKKIFAKVLAAKLRGQARGRVSELALIKKLVLNK